MSKRSSKLGWLVAGVVALGWLGSGDDDKPTSTPTSPRLSQPGSTPQPPASFVRLPPKAVQQPSAAETLYTTANVNMRTEPSTSSPILTTIPKGSQVVAVGSRGAWRSVQYRGRAGWVSSRYVSRERPVLTSTPRPPPHPPGGGEGGALKPPPRDGQGVRGGGGHMVKAATVHMTGCVTVVGAVAIVHGVGQVGEAPSAIGSRGADSKLGGGKWKRRSR